MTPLRGSIGDFAAQLEAIEDPSDRLAEIRKLRVDLVELTERVAEILRLAILDLRAGDPPSTWAEIGEILQVTPQRAMQLAQPKEKQ